MFKRILNLFTRSRSQSNGITINGGVPIVDNALKFGDTLLGLFKDTKGKLSSKRTVSGLLAIAAVQDMNLNGLNYFNISLSLISIIPIIFTSFERSNPPENR
jgi:hypothetical protein|tara:strand:- start:5367 stop:5672 length:306 start_codon:yes stop_codon:yes gene_type:complete